ncbi:hypothetical protein LTR27_003220 [Elasticomyces elasticus]|nr:hypothetical protein LTR27_003220 [Elasticomyces elasticus]
MASKLIVDVYTVPAFATATIRIRSSDSGPQQTSHSSTTQRPAYSAIALPQLPKQRNCLPGSGPHFQVAEGAAKQYANPAAEKFWPGQLPTKQVIFEALPENNQFEPFDGVTMKAYDVVHGDCAHNSYLHVPDLNLVVAGDVVYGDCHQYLVEVSTKEKREQWLAALNEVEAWRPQIVVPGHARASRVWGAYLIESTRKYIHAFAEELAKADSVGEMVANMQELYPERWNLFLLEVACATSFANKGK